MIKTNMNAKMAFDVLSYINARHNGTVKISKEYQKKLKANFGEDFHKIFMLFGDPDKPNNFEKVQTCWINFVEILSKIGHDIIICFTN
jgi:hypothetical protein